MTEYYLLVKDDDDPGTFVPTWERLAETVRDGEFYLKLRDKCWYRALPGRYSEKNKDSIILGEIDQQREEALL
jgi:hypothetical protein